VPPPVQGTSRQRFLLLRLQLGIKMRRHLEPRVVRVPAPRKSPPQKSLRLRSLRRPVRDRQAGAAAAAVAVAEVAADASRRLLKPLLPPL
jgi:hypothetical protein